MLRDKRILLIISGGIAAYKALDLIRRLRERGADVRCILTRGGAEFVTPLSVATLSRNKVFSDIFSLMDESEIGHIRLARECDLVVVAPATADIIARMATGLANDLATTVLLATDRPVLIAPAMNFVMWEHPATKANVETLIERGVQIVGPAEGELAEGEVGVGRMSEPLEIVQAIEAFFRSEAVLSGCRALVTSGPTYEPIDPVRFIGNRSSGRQGYALAATAAARGAEVTLISANVALDDPAGVKVIRVESALDMRTAVLEAAAHADAVVMAAAVADFRPAATAESKIKKTDAEPEPIRLVKNPDILAELCTRRREGAGDAPAVIVGFAAETDDVLANGRAKLARKGCDLLVVNQVGPNLAFGTPDNAATVLGADGSVTEIPRGPKEALAGVVWDLVAARLPERAPQDGPAAS